MENKIRLHEINKRNQAINRIAEELRDDILNKKTRHLYNSDEEYLIGVKAAAVKKANEYDRKQRETCTHFLAQN